MDFKRMFEKEKKNYNRIFLYVDSEQEMCRAYEFSAYLLTRMFDSLEMQEETKRELGTILFVTRIPLETIVKQFTGPNTTVGDRFIKVILDDPSRCVQWKAEFSELKKQQQIDNFRLGKAILGFARLGKSKPSHTTKTD